MLDFDEIWILKGVFVYFGGSFSVGSGLRSRFAVFYFCSYFRFYGCFCRLEILVRISRSFVVYEISGRVVGFF